MHVASGDLWAGAEAQVAQLLCALNSRPDVDIAAVVLNPGELADRLVAEGIAARVIDEHSLGLVGCFRSLYAFIREWDPDIVHTHRYKENVLGSIAARLAGVPLCVRTAHGEVEFDPGSPSIRRSLRTMADRAVAKGLQHGIFAVSEQLGIKLQGQFPGLRVYVVPNGLDADHLRNLASPKIVLDSDHRHVAFVGRLVPVKRVDIYLRTARLLLERADGRFHFHVIGDGPLRRDLEKQAATLELANHCTFHGFLSESPRWIAAMDCVVLTSEREGLPMVALEALALGTPMVAPAIGGLKALLAHCESCGLVGDMSSASFARSIQQVVSRPRSSRESLLPDEYTARAMVDTYLAIYKAAFDARVAQ